MAITASVTAIKLLVSVNTTDAAAKIAVVASIVILPFDLSSVTPVVLLVSWVTAPPEPVL